MKVEQESTHTDVSMVNQYLLSVYLGGKGRGEKEEEDVGHGGKWAEVRVPHGIGLSGFVSY